jgi:hypothetical protein
MSVARNIILFQPPLLPIGAAYTHTSSSAYSLSFMKGIQHCGLLKPRILLFGQALSLYPNSLKQGTVSTLKSSHARLLIHFYY